MSDRKDDHIRLALDSQTGSSLVREALCYEPLFKGHNEALKNVEPLKREFLGKSMRAPLWISSMTGGGTHSKKLNSMFAEAAAKYGLGMGLGSCRPILDDLSQLEDFDVRHIIGPDLPLLSNIGHAQAEELFLKGELSRLDEMNERLSTDALILHLNPLQEWFQPEGDRFEMASIDLIHSMLEQLQTPLVVKEVGQGFGPRSLQALMDLPLAAIEFGAFGGTNFSKLEELRNESRSAGQVLDPLCFVGRTAEMMVKDINQILESLKNKAEKNIPMFIISGGIQDYLHGFELMQRLKAPSVYAQAGAFLRPAQESKESLFKYIENQINGLLMAESFLELSPEQ